MKNSDNKKKEMGKKMTSIQEKHAKMANELNARNKANPKKYKRYLEDSHRVASEGRYSEQ